MRTFAARFGILIGVLLAGCEDVIEVDVQEAPERLVIEASLDWEKGTAGNIQTIRLSRSTPFFAPGTDTAVTGAVVTVTQLENNVVYDFVDQGDGTYRITDFVPVIGQAYSLRVEYQGDVYTALETMTPVTEFTEVSQDRAEGFDPELLEVHVRFIDPADQANNYLLSFQRRGDPLPVLEVGEDEFVNGNEIDWWFEIDSDGDLEPFAPGDVVDIEMYGISRAYYDFIKILADQQGGVGLFDTTPVTVRGNCINLTRPENYAFGYFRLSEVVKTTYTFVED